MSSFIDYKNGWHGIEVIFEGSREDKTDASGLPPIKV
jgi:hypothetical protein